MGEDYLTVSQINSYIKRKLNDPNLKNIYVKGEISNYNNYSNGHSYFTLKDKNSEISAVLFKNYKKFLKFKPQNGMKVIVKGRVEVYEKGGRYQLQAFRITEDGVGDLHVAFEQLKKKLDGEGLFSKEHKQKIPKFPKRIGIVTAKNSAAVRDIITTINRRYPACEILVFPTLVQGEMAAPQIARQIRHSQNFDIDTLIVGRGGGSIEDLWPFNEEIVAREIYASKIPVISAVGHEIDYTIADFVADLRAATPTAAGEYAVPNIKEVKFKVDQFSKRINKSIDDRLMQNKNKLDTITKKQVMKNPESIYEIKQMHLDNMVGKINYFSKNIISTNKNKLEIIKNSKTLKNPKTIYQQKETELNTSINKLNYSSKQIISTNKNKLEIIKNSKILKNPNEVKNMKEDKFLVTVEKLKLLNPLETLKRGYSIAKSDGKLVTSSKDVKSGDKLEIKFKDGTVNTKVI